MNSAKSHRLWRWIVEFKRFFYFNKEDIIHERNFGVSTESIFFKIGKKIGYWYAANKDFLLRELFGGIIRKLPGGRWLWKFFR